MKKCVLQKMTKDFLAFFSCGCNHTNLSTITLCKGNYFLLKTKEIDADFTSISLLYKNKINLFYSIKQLNCNRVIWIYS